MVKTKGLNSAVSSVSHGEDVFLPTSVLTPGFALPNVLDPSYEPFLKEKKIIPEETVVWIPRESPIRMDWYNSNWVAVHETAFRSGNVLPFSPLMADVMKAIKVMPCQLMPAVWRLVCSVEALCEKHGLEIRVEDLQNHYCLRSHSHGRFLFRVRSNQESLIDNLDSGEDKGWASNYLFVKKASLGSALDYLNFPLVKTSKYFFFFLSCIC